DNRFPAPCDSCPFSKRFSLQIQCHVSRGSPLSAARPLCQGQGISWQAASCLLRLKKQLLLWFLGRYQTRHHKGHPSDQATVCTTSGFPASPDKCKSHLPDIPFIYAATHKL